MWFLTTGPRVIIPGSSQSFPSERTASVSSRSITVTNKSNHLTCCLFFCQHLAVGCYQRRRTFRDPYGFHFGRVKVLPAEQLHACSRVHHQLSFLRVYCGCGQQTPLIGWRKECSFFLFFELKDVLGKSPRVSEGASLLSFSLLLRSVLKSDSVGDCADEEVWLVFFCSDGPLLSRMLA